METNFFQQMYPLTELSDVHIIIARSGPDELVISVMPVNEKCTDPAKKQMLPLNFTGSVELFDKTFFDKIQTPISKAQELMCDMESWMVAQQRAREASQKEKAEKEKHKVEKEKEKKLLEEADKKFDAQMLKVKELEEKEKIGEAIGALPTVKDFPHRENDITEKLNALKSKHPQFGLGF